MSEKCVGTWDAARLSRRSFLQKAGMGFGGIALAQLLQAEGLQAEGPPPEGTVEGALKGPHFAPKAKRVIYLFQSGGPSQLDLFDYKPLLNQRNGEQLPDSVRKGQRLTGMSGNQASLPLAGSIFGFTQYGQSGAWMSELLPRTAELADDLCFVKSMFTEAINHDPAITFFQTGSERSGRPSLGAWLSYGLGSLNDNLPSYVVMITKNKADQPIYARLWGSGFLPTEYQGVQFRSGKDPVLFLENPGDIGQESRKMLLDRLRQLHEIEEKESPVEARIAQYEMAFRMQTSAPEVADFSSEPQSVLDAYGPNVLKPGSYAYNCLMARRLAERNVRCIQIFHRGWDHHGGLPAAIRKECVETDQPTAALVRDLKQRGMLEDTLVVWGGEFGRTNYSQGTLTATDYGRDHHPRCFTLWMAGGGVKPGLCYGSTDDFGYSVTENGVHVHDFHATMLHLLGLDHERLTYRFKGRQFRLTDVSGRVVRELMA